MTTLYVCLLRLTNVIIQSNITLLIQDGDRIDDSTPGFRVVEDGQGLSIMTADATHEGRFGNTLKAVKFSFTNNLWSNYKY